MEQDDKDIDTLVDKWTDTKQEIASLEKKLEKYKKYAEHLMKKTNTSELKGTSYTIKRHDLCRSVMSKDDVPKEVWTKYSRNINYNMFTIKKNKK